MPKDREVTLWPTREQYPRFIELCDDDVIPTFEEFEARVGAQLEDMARGGTVIDRIDFDPDRMARWCRAHYGQVDAVARAHYAAFLALSD